VERLTAVFSICRGRTSAEERSGGINGTTPALIKKHTGLPHFHPVFIADATDPDPYLFKPFFKDINIDLPVGFEVFYNSQCLREKERNINNTTVPATGSTGEPLRPSGMVKIQQLFTIPMQGLQPDPGQQNLWQVAVATITGEIGKTEVAPHLSAPFLVTA
jgi:hypothetical protein